jgi:hypothetical protein
MIRKSYMVVLLLAGVIVGLVASGRLAIHAQQAGGARPADPGGTVRGETAEGPRREGDRGRAARAETEPSRPPQGLPPATTVQDVLLRPFHFPFNRPTSLSQVCLQLKQALAVPVVLDLAALGRQDVDPDDTVQLELDGVRLKTGLKLLLDQVGLTYHVVPEDNLLIITDREGSEDPLDRIWAELRTLHRDIHDIQDAVDEMSDSLYKDAEEGPRMRKPTIIEEKPGGDPFPAEPEGAGNKPERPGQRPGTMEGPAHQGPAPRTTPGRVPLSKSHRAL